MHCASKRAHAAERMCPSLPCSCAREAPRTCPHKELENLLLLCLQRQVEGKHSARLTVQVLESCLPLALSPHFRRRQRAAAVAAAAKGAATAAKGAAAALRAALRAAVGGALGAAPLAVAAAAAATVARAAAATALAAAVAPPAALAAAAA